jgi:hypothetical protein
MKLAKIAHVRCGEDTFKQTVVWIPDEMTDEQFETEVCAARDEYLKHLKEFKDAPPPNDFKPYSSPHYDLQPQKTVSEIRQEWEKKRKVWEEWNAQKKKLTRHFTDFLDGRAGIQSFWRVEVSPAIDLDWGHHHGWPIEYDESKGSWI